MKSLVVAVKSMSSLEIAELTGKRHDHVMNDIRKMLDDLGIDAPVFLGTYKAGRNNTYECFNLPKNETIALISGYSAVLRMAIINVLESNFGEVNDDFTIINDEVLILNAIQKLGVDFNENEDLRIFDKDNLVLIMNFSKFNKHGIERSQADTGLIMYKAHTESAYATICEDALML